MLPNGKSRIFRLFNFNLKFNGKKIQTRTQTRRFQASKIC